MNFFKKLIGGAKDVSDNSSAASPAANGSSKNLSASASLPKREPRIRLVNLHRIQFLPLEIQTSVDTSSAGPASLRKLSDKTVDLFNISTKGMGILFDSTGKFKLGDDWGGKLSINESAFDVEGKVRHVSPTMTGFEFTSPTIPLRDHIREYLKVEISAVQLRPVAEAYLKPDPRGRINWFTDGKQNEFYAISDDKGLVAFHMSFLGHYLEGARGERVRGGMVRDDGDSEETSHHKSSDLVDLGSELAPDLAQLAARFLQNIEKLSPDLRNDVLRSIQL